ncbi:hypothetical protein [Actinomadura miaoliensis]|uniref:Uncharacterized protein n=1 Tax=Actinomadura miaoliensis TaxID=430685 RepID=A0ABP7V5M9_9ACTN
MDQYGRLRALAEQLTLAGVETEAWTAVVTPGAVETITCREREDDGGKLWFFTSDGTPIAEADDEHLDDAAVLLLGFLARLAEGAAQAEEAEDAAVSS